MNYPVGKNYINRESIHSPIVGRLVRIHGDEVYEDILGIYLGSFRVPKWDPEGEYTFHMILSHEDCAVHNYCIRNKNPSCLIKVIA